MCLGIPGQVVELTDPAAYLARVDVNGIKRVISVRLLADVGLAPGDWVLVHVGFAMAKIDEREAALTLDQIKKMGQVYTDELDAFRSTDLTSQTPRKEASREVRR
jgi:hydrogenase expression/formation protein HypC